MSWKFLAIPNVTLYGFLRVHGKYWAVGTERIHKDQTGGGYGVPVALYSSDGERWDHSNNDLSACKPRMCVGCSTEQKAEGAYAINLALEIAKERNRQNRGCGKRSNTGGQVSNRTASAGLDI